MDEDPLVDTSVVISVEVGLEAVVELDVGSVEDELEAGVGSVDDELDANDGSDGDEL